MHTSYSSLHCSCLTSFPSVICLCLPSLHRSPHRLIFIFNYHHHLPSLHLIKQMTFPATCFFFTFPLHSLSEPFFDIKRVALGARVTVSLSASHSSVSTVQSISVFLISSCLSSHTEYRLCPSATVHSHHRRVTRKVARVSCVLTSPFSLCPPSQSNNEVCLMEIEEED